MNSNSYGFLRIGCATPEVKKAAIKNNEQEVITIINQANDANIGLLLLPEMVISGTDLGNLYAQRVMYLGQVDALNNIAKATEGLDITVVLGAYEKIANCLYKINYIIRNGEIIDQEIVSILSKEERKFFSESIDGYQCQILDSKNQITISFGEDSTIQLIPSSEEITVGQFEYIKNYVKVLSGKNHNIVVYSGLNGICAIAENGKLLASKSAFDPEKLIFVDCDTLIVEHEKLTSDKPVEDEITLPTIIEPLTMWNGGELCRDIRPNPFEPTSQEELYSNCYEIFEIQANALAHRISHTHSKVSVVGISGGLDSTLALLVTAYAHKKLGKSPKDIIAVTMPGFGTTGRTYENALSMMKSVGATVKEISIVNAVTQHFKDIDHDIDNHDVTYENAQARERTQILMDIANQEGGIVVGTGDLSEEALGWCTFNGDHISMYGVNAGVPKTVIKFIVKWFIDVKLKIDEDFSEDNQLLAKTLSDILDTPISPELLPPDKDGNIAQKTEDNVGPYQLHDFFIYYTVRYATAPEKLLFLATKAFEGQYDEEFIKKWLEVFYKRFFAQQFKRSCSPDSPKIGTIDLSPACWNMPSDAFSTMWLETIK